MDGRKWYTRAQYALILLSILFLAVGAMFTESGATELSYEQRDNFTIDESHEGMTFILLTETTEDNCEEYFFQLEDLQGHLVEVEKTPCDRWSDPESYQYRFNLMPGEYSYQSSDWVSVVAVEGDLEEYMSDYAFGNAIADVGACFCCLGILGYVVVGRSFAGVPKKEETVFIMPAPPEIQPTPMPTLPAIIEPLESIENGEENEPSGTFWNGLVDD
jgi:hypothetical protein